MAEVNCKRKAEEEVVIEEEEEEEEEEKEEEDEEEEDGEEGEENGEDGEEGEDEEEKMKESTVNKRKCTIDISTMGNKKRWAERAFVCITNMIEKWFVDICSYDTDEFNQRITIELSNLATKKKYNCSTEEGCKLLITKLDLLIELCDISHIFDTENEVRQENYSTARDRIIKMKESAEKGDKDPCASFDIENEEEFNNGYLFPDSVAKLITVGINNARVFYTDWLKNNKNINK